MSETVKTGLVAGLGGAKVQHDFTLPVSGTVKYSVNNTFSQASLISYLAVAKDLASAANEQAVLEAKGIIEGATYSVKKDAAVSEEAVRTWLAQTISGLPGFHDTGVTLGDITLSAFQEATEDTEGSFTFSVTLSRGEASAEGTASGTITLPEPDMVPPVISLIGAAEVTLSLGAEYTDAGASAYDDQDGDITERIVTTVTSDVYSLTELDTAQAGEYIFHYNVSDTAGNAAVEVTRTVTVSEEELPPVEQPTPTPTPAPEPSAIPAPAVTPTPKPAVTPSPSPSSETEKVIKPQDLPAPADGVLTVQLTDVTESVLLPAEIIGMIGANTLRLAWNTVAVDLSPEVLKSIREKAVSAGGQQEGTAIRLYAVKTARAAAEQLMNNPAVNGSVRLTAASEVISFSLEVVAADGSTVPVTAFAKPLTVTFAVDSKANRDLLGVYYIAANGAVDYMAGKLTDGNGTISTAVNHFSQYAVLEYDKSFSDVSSNSWASGVIKSMAAKHIIEGISRTEFHPQGEVTRAQFAAMITRALRLKAASPSASAFTDVDSRLWYAEAVAAVNEAGIVLGRSKEAFAPDEHITREEMAVMIVRAYEHLKGSKSSSESAASSFNDHTLIRDWAKSAASTAEQAGLIKGRSNQQFAPQATMTRAESAQVISNLLGHM